MPMQFRVTNKQPGGSGEISIGLAGKAVEIWTVIADRYDYTTEDLRASGFFPEVYTTFHPQNVRLRFQPVAIEQSAEDPSLFICTLTWSSEKFDPKEEEEKKDDPLDRRARITVKSAKIRETKHRDFYGKPKVNVVGDPFDPPIENNVSFKIIGIRRNVTVFPDWVFDFDDCVNSLPFTIKGRVIAKGCAWIADLDLGEENTDGPIPYSEARVELHLRKPRKPVSGEDPADVPYPWDTEQLNEGLYCLATTDTFDVVKQRCKIKDDTGEEIDSPGPMPLKADGFQVPLPPLSDESDLNYIVFRDHEYKDFNEIAAFLWGNA